MSLIEAQAANLKVIASDSIPQNTCISNSIKYISINKSNDYWAKECHKLLTNKNVCEIDKNKSEKFDIKIQIKEIENFYLSI